MRPPGENHGRPDDRIAGDAREIKPQGQYHSTSEHTVIEYTGIVANGATDENGPREKTTFDGSRW